MRILHINPFFYPYFGGTENYLLELCKRLSKNNSVSVVTSRLPGTKKVEEVEGTKVYRIRSLILRKLPAFLPPPFSIPFSFRRNLFKVCELERPEIIHLHNRFFINFARVAFWKKQLGIPLFLTLHNARTVGISKEIDFWGQLFDDLIGNEIMRRSDWIIANSKWTRDITVPKDYPRERTEVIYNGVDAKKFKRIKTDLKDELGCDFLSTTVCRLIPQKGVKYLVKAVKGIKHDYKAVIVGRGPELKTLQSLAKKLGVQKKFVFVTQFIPERKLIEYYSASDFFVLPSLWEPFGIVFIEAMACGNPVIATNIGGIPEVVTSKCGILVKPRNSEEIAKSIKMLIDDKNLRKKLGTNARKRVENIFDFDVVAKKVEMSYKNYLEGRLSGLTLPT
jgi:glycosyltransferase involved in cell wall biosynthesis